MLETNNQRFVVQLLFIHTHAPAYCLLAEKSTFSVMIFATLNDAIKQPAIMDALDL